MKKREPNLRRLNALDRARKQLEVQEGRGAIEVREIAQRVGKLLGRHVSPVSMSRWLSDLREPSVDVWLALARVLNVDAETLAAVPWINPTQGGPYESSPT